MLFLVIALLVFITQSLFYHWWFILIDCFVAALLVGKQAGSAFLSGFLGVGVVWLGQILYTNSMNEGLLLDRIGILFGLKGYWIIIITILIGGITGGFSALTGYHLKTLWKKKD